MTESLEGFLKGAKTKGLEVSGSFECQECREVVKAAALDEDRILSWKCSNNHISKVSL
jgi:hypothetical protein